MGALVDGRVWSVPVPADAESVAVRGDPGEICVQALVDDRVDRTEHQFLGQNRVTQVGHPSAHCYLISSGIRLAARIHHTGWPSASFVVGDRALKRHGAAAAPCVYGFSVLP